MAVKSRAVLLAQAQTIRDEVVVNANTATRVGGHEVDVVDSYILTSEANTNYAAAVHTHAAGDVTSGTMADARIAQSNVTQHQAALSITESQISDLSHTDTDAIHDNVAGEINAVSEKATPVSGDWVLIEDSADSNNKKKAQLGNLPTATPTESIIISCSDLTSDLAADTSVAYIRMPYAFTLSEVRASVLTAPTGAPLLTVDINESGSSILSTKLTFDAGEKTTTTATTPPVISDSSLADDAEITIDIDSVGGTIAGAGLQVTLIGTQT